MKREIRYSLMDVSKSSSGSDSARELNSWLQNRRFVHYLFKRIISPKNCIATSQLNPRTTLFRTDLWTTSNDSFKRSNSKECLFHTNELSWICEENEIITDSYDFRKLEIWSMSHMNHFNDVFFFFFHFGAWQPHSLWEESQEDLQRHG